MAKRSKSKSKAHGIIWWLFIGWWWLPIKQICFKIPMSLKNTFSGHPAKENDGCHDEHLNQAYQVQSITAKPIISDYQMDIVIPNKKDGAPLAYHYRVKINLTDKESLLRHHEQKEWYFTPIETDGDIYLFMGDDEIGILSERVSMLKYWLRKGDPYILCFENLSEDKGCFGHIAFYRDKRKEHEWREQTVIALDAYKSKDRQSTITNLEEGHELKLIDVSVKSPSYNVQSGKSVIGKLPKEYAQKVSEEGAHVVFFEKAQYDGEYKERPYVRIYWTTSRADLTEEDAEKYVTKTPNIEFSKDKLSTKKGLLNFKDYVVLDCETTGFSPKDNEIIEIAMIKYIGGKKVSELSSLVQPFGVIPDRITEITGIKNSDVANSPIISEIVESIWDFINGFTLVGHNITFDIGFLKKVLSDAGYVGSFKYVDTLQLARIAFPQFPDHKLETCIKMLSLSDSQTHRALDDVICTQQLLEKCLPVLLEKREQELADRRQYLAEQKAKKDGPDQVL